MLRLRSGVCPALTPGTYQKLISAEVKTVVQFLAQDLDQLSAKIHVPFRDLLSIKRFFLAQHSSIPVNALQLYQNILSSTCILPTGCTGLDKILEGGLYTGEITELVGASSSGKTQICLSTVKAISSDLEKNIVYFDTCGQFDTTRIATMISAAGLDGHALRAALQRIRLVQVFDVFDLFTELELLKNAIEGSDDVFYKSLKLVVFDSLGTLTAPVSLRGDSSSGGLLVHLMRVIKSLAVEFMLGALMTNNAAHSEHVWKAANHPGQLLSHMSDTRLEVLHDQDFTQLKLHTLIATNDHQRTVKLIKSCRQPTGLSVQICIKDSGLESKH